jgi:hypothetical protein
VWVTAGGAAAACFLRERVAAAFFAGALRARVFAAFLLAARCLRVAAAFLAAALRFLICAAFLPADFRFGLIRPSLPLRVEKSIRAVAAGEFSSPACHPAGNCPNSPGENLPIAQKLEQECCASIAQKSRQFFGR